MPRHRDEWFKAAYPDILEPLCKYLRRFVSPEMAEDLAHDAFLKVYAAPDFDSIRSPRSYLFRTARNLALNATSEHGASRTECVEEIAGLADERASVERQAMTDEEFDLLSIAISRLSPQRRKVLVLRLFYECSTSEIANKLDISLRTVHRDLAGALDAIHAARAAVEADRGSIIARLLRKRRQRRRTR